MHLSRERLDLAVPVVAWLDVVLLLEGGLLYAMGGAMDHGRPYPMTFHLGLVAYPAILVLAVILKISGRLGWPALGVTALPMALVVVPWAMSIVWDWLVF